MTGPTANLLSSGPPVSYLPIRLPLGLDNGTNDILAKTTIDLHDAATIWPSRSLERRCAFQNLLTRYNRQILHGCKNPLCETPICLSHQKRIAKGPFRPYTVLSARSLATFLASQDHPESGLCPHQPVDTNPGSLSPSKEDELAGENTKSREHLIASPRPSKINSIPTAASGVGSTSFPGRKIKVHIANGHTKTLGLESEDSRARGHAEPQNKSSMRKERDPKSFTQNLFDTVAMKLLHRANASDSHPPWASSNEKCQVMDHADPNSNVVESKRTGRDSENTGKDVEGSLVPDTGSTGAGHGESPTEFDSVPEYASIRSDLTSSDVVSSSGIMQASTNLGKGPEKSETLGNNREAHHAANTEAKKSTVRAAMLPSNVLQPFLQSKKQDVAETMSLQKFSVSGTSQSSPPLDSRAQSLSHFTSANIIALTEPRAACDSDLHEQHCLLKYLGRTDLPQHSSKCGSYGDFLAYSGQSMTYILSNVDALLQSFLHCDDGKAASKVIRPYEFPLIVDLFRKLRRIDMHPQKIFPSLWISAGRLYPISAGSSKRRPLTASAPDSFALDPLSTSHARSLNDLEACHVVKILFAALVASVPKCSPMSWLAVRKLHASGQVAPFVDTDNSPAEQKMIGKLVRTLHAFENEMALDLVMRLARSLDIRYHLSRAKALAEHSEKHRRQFPPSFSRVLDYVNSDSLKISITNTEGQPSLKNKEWIDPGIESITWHPKEWPIIIEWLRAVILKVWDGKAKIAKGSAVGGALGLLLYIHEHANMLRLDWDLFHTPFLSERLDVLDEPPAWVNSGSVGWRSEVHLLDFPFLFPPSALVAYFRSINHAAMYAAYRDSAAASRLRDGLSWPDGPTGRGTLRLHDRLHYATTEYLVLEARRDHILKDAMNEIYRRQKRELMRPLKVRIVGEEGIDHGGVQQEFFRLAIAEALNPDYGVFTTDATTRTSWFHPSSPEPAYKFELLGILVSLAVYNGLTLPFTFPLVMYRKLSGLHHHTLSDLEDGWPELVNGLKALRDWKDGDVKDVFMRTYVFSIDKFGVTEDRLIGQYEKAEQRDEDQLEFVEGKWKKSVRVLRIKRKPNQACRTAAEEGEEDALSYLRGGQIQGVSAEVTTDEISTADSQTLFPHLTGLGYPAMATITNEEETLEYLKTRETKGVTETDVEFCMSDSSSANPLPAGPATEDTPMVTDKNRDQYIRDYIHQLTHKTVYDQFDAFRYGFFTCFHPKAISLFTPSALKALVEGLPDVSVAGLERVTRYDGGYDFFHPTIRQFWTIVHSWPQEKVRRLLEFVTASDRLPVGGVGKLLFTVQKNGSDEGRLPTSLTCFGRLLLPEYSSEERLREALAKAVENSKGFGLP